MNSFESTCGRCYYFDAPTGICAVNLTHIADSINNQAIKANVALINHVQASIESYRDCELDRDPDHASTIASLIEEIGDYKNENKALASQIPGCCDFEQISD